MLPHDYLTWRLCGEHVTDRGEASGTGWFDPVSDTVRQDLLDVALTGVSGWSGELPRVLGPSDVAGQLTSEAAAELGLPIGVVVGPGTGDNMAAALGLGLRQRDVAISLGTSGTAFAVSATPTRDDSGAVAGFASGERLSSCRSCAHSTPPRSPTPSPDGSASMRPGWPSWRWRPSTIRARSSLVPYFDGERTPNLPDARARWSG